MILSGGGGGARRTAALTDGGRGQGAALGGLGREFVCGARLDNLASCFVAVEALEAHCAHVGGVGAGGGGGFAADMDVSVVALFDHEEVRRVGRSTCSLLWGEGGGVQRFFKTKSEEGWGHRGFLKTKTE